MIDFSTLQGLTIPEGNVTQIADASGNVLWKAAPSGATVKLKVVNGGHYSSITTSTFASITIDGVAYNTTEELIIPIGTVLVCKCSSNGSNKMYLNGEEVVTYKESGSSNVCYDYTVKGDVEITYGGSMSVSGGGPSGPSYSYSATIRITEL